MAVSALVGLVPMRSGCEGCERSRRARTSSLRYALDRSIATVLVVGNSVCASARSVLRRPYLKSVFAGCELIAARGSRRGISVPLAASALPACAALHGANGNAAAGRASQPNQFLPR